MPEPHTRTARQWAQEHGMESSHQAAVLERIFAILDEMLLWDNMNICNSAAAEYLARWAYALEMTFEECSKKEN